MQIESSDYRISEVAPADWPRLLAGFEDHTVFHTLPWLEAICMTRGASCQLAQARDRDGNCVGLWPVLATRKGPLWIQGSPVPGWNTPYLGPLLAPRCDVPGAIKALLDHDLLQRGSYFSCKISNPGPHNDLARFGFDEVERLDTYCVDLSPPKDRLWGNLKSECRTRIRKATKEGLEVRVEEDGSFLDDFWNMAVQTFAICGIKPTYTRETLDAVWTNLHAAGSVRILSAYLRGERVATLFLPFDRHTMYYWAGASHLQHRGLPSHNLLHWEAITLAQSLGLSRYDFVSTAGNAGRFKSTFGPEVVHAATQWERASSWLVRALKSGYRLYLEHAHRISACAAIGSPELVVQAV